MKLAAAISLALALGGCETTPTVSDGYKWGWVVFLFNDTTEFYEYPTSKLSADAKQPDAAMAAKYAEAVRAREYPQCKLTNEERDQQDPIGGPSWEAGWNFFLICRKPNSTR